MRVHLPPHPSSVAGARAATADFFATLGDARTIDLDDALLAVSELVTNALDAGADEIHLELTHRSGALTISVEDNAPGWPAARPADATAERGRGLGIVAALADRWDVEPSSLGKTVTATFSAR